VSAALGVDDDFIIKPQAGPQEKFLSSSADVCIYGGAAGSGKSFALLLESMRYASTVQGFDSVVFRRSTVDLRRPGGLWSESMKLFPHAGGLPIAHRFEWLWPRKGSVKLAHLEHETTVLDWHGSQVGCICFDELTTFTRTQFWYLFSRNRSRAGIRPYIRATCNADAGSWVMELIEWWIDPDTGYPIEERSGIVRYFARGADDQLLWFDTKREAMAATGQAPETIKSLTFIAAKLSDNPALTRSDPGYLGNLMMLHKVERERLLNGNWKIRPSAGLYFNRSWCQIVDIPPVCVKCVRGWDLAATEQKDNNDPDWTACTKIGVMHDGRWIVLHADAFRGSPAEVDRRVLNYAQQDGYEATTSLPKDPGQAGVAQVVHLTHLLAGYIVENSPESGDKVTRFGPFSSQAEVGNVLVLRGRWNDRFFTELENFPEGTHDDDADATSRAFNAIAQQPPMRIDPDELRKLGIHLPPDIPSGAMFPDSPH
jgi:predicted phage terminase large subunit-like protein